jgi:hypothetical protein
MPQKNGAEYHLTKINLKNRNIFLNTIIIILTRKIIIIRQEYSFKFLGSGSRLTGGNSWSITASDV